MASSYAEYAHKKVPLSDVLAYIDEMLDLHQKSILRVNGTDSAENLQYLVGKIQGIDHVLKRLEYQFGVNPERDN